MMKKVQNFLCVVIALFLFAASFPISDFVIDANAASEQYLWPVEGIYGIGSNYGLRDLYGTGNFDNYHRGIDINSYGSTVGAADGCPVRATKSGTIYHIVNNIADNTFIAGSFGNCVRIDHGDGTYSLYAHMKPVGIKACGSVKQGEVIGYIGNTGESYGAHLHFQLFTNKNDPNGSTLNPMPTNANISLKNTYKLPAGWPSAKTTYVFDMPSIGVNLVKYSYPSHCTIKVTENDKNIMSLPCSNKTNSKSDKVESAPKDTTYEAIGLIKNTEDNLWYKVKAKNGKEGYIFAGNVSFVSAITSDITGPGISVPSNHTHGKTYVLTGSVNSSYNELTNVSAYVYSGSNKITGGTESVNGKSYSLGRSAIDNQTEFNKLAVGQYTYKVTASYKSYYAKTDKAYGTKTGTVNVYSQTFNVVSGSVSPTVPQQPTTIIYPNNEGIYKIASGVGNNMYLDFACTSNNVQIYENCDGHSDPAFVISQYFRLTHVGDGWYTIINIGNGKCADIANTNPASGINIMQWDCYPNDGQLYRFYDAGNGYCYIKSKLGTYVDVANGDSVNNTNVWAYSFNGSNAQKWKLELHTHSYVVHYEADHPHRVYNRCSCGDWYYTGATTSVSSCSQCNPAEPSTIIYPTNGDIYKIAYGGGNNMYLHFDCTSTNVQIYENCNGHSNSAFVISQYFKLTHIGDGWYTIINVGNGKCLDIEATNPASGTNIMQWDCYPNDGQLYRFYDAGDGYCYIKSKLGTYVDKKNGDTSSDTNVWSYEFNGTVAQKWKLEKHSHSYISQITKSATCTTTGNRTYTCTKCAHTYDEILAKNPSNHVNTKKVAAVAATTEKVGYTEGVYCNDCKKYISGHKEIPKLTIAIGDLDGDGKISAADARLALRASVGLEILTPEERLAADVDGDGTISSADARLILRASVGLESLDAVEAKKEY